MCKVIVYILQTALRACMRRLSNDAQPESMAPGLLRSIPMCLHVVCTLILGRKITFRHLPAKNISKCESKYSHVGPSPAITSSVCLWSPVRKRRQRGTAKHRQSLQAESTLAPSFYHCLRPSPCHALITSRERIKILSNLRLR